MNAQQLAQAVYDEILKKHGGVKPKYDSDEASEIMHRVAKQNNVPIFAWPQAVEMLVEMMN